MKKPFLFFGLIIFFFQCTHDEEIQPSPVLDELLKLGENNSINRYTIDWEDTKEQVYAVYKDVGEDQAIRKFLAILGDNHSYYIAENGKGISSSQIRCGSPNSNVSNIPDHVGCVQVTGFSGSSVEGIAFANNIQNIIKNQDSENLIGWIVDLNRNTGGNMYPMVAGLGPILGDNVLGYFIDPDDEKIAWGYDNGSSYALSSSNSVTTVSEPYTLINTDVKVAVIISNQTASSGEATAVSFIGMPNTRFFGQATCGLSTANRSFSLNSGGTLVLTVSTMADRNMNAYGSQIQPDESFDDIQAMNNRILEWLNE